MLTRSQDGGAEVADGQQRLSTTSIFIAAVRDYFWEKGATKKAAQVENEYLLTSDLRSEAPMARLRLNVDDNEFYTRRIISNPADASRKETSEPTKESHRLLLQAASVCREFVEQIIAPYKENDRADRLVDWVEFIKSNVEIILLTVPDHMNAFVMFETLNDRGLRASQADLLKNYLLRHATSRISEAQQKWATMLGALEALGAGDDATVTYLRCMAVCLQGVTREREVYATVTGLVGNQSQALTFLHELSGGSTEYASIFNAEHPFWNAHGDGARGHIRTLLELRTEQIRPLVFAAIKRFNANDLKAALRMCLSWSVRFMIVGGGRGGVLDKAYSEHANQVYQGKIKTAAALAASMAAVVPGDVVFEAAFKEARVSQTHLARYYLRALELAQSGQPEPETIPNDDPTVINLEHVMPIASAQEGWDGIDPETCSLYYRRIGNMALLQAKANSIVGSQPFGEKRATLKASSYLLTKEIGKKKAWGPDQIQERQGVLAALAVKTWPMS